MAWKILRVLLAVAFGVIGLVLFAVLFCLDLPAVRRLVANKVDGVLATTFAGRMSIERIDHLGLSGLSGARVRLVDPDGIQVLLVDGANVRVSLLAVVKSALLDKGDLVIDLSEVNVAYLDANLDTDPAGNLRIAKSLQPRDQTPADPNARGTAIHLPSLSAGHIWVHGQPAAGAPLLDAEIDDLKAAVVSAPHQTSADVTHLALLTRNMPSGANLRANIEAHYAAPAQSGRQQSAAVRLRGELGGLPTSLDATMDGQQIAATLDVPKVAAERVRAMAENAPLHADVALHAEAKGVLPEIDTQLQASLGDGTLDVAGHIKTGDVTQVHQKLQASNIDLRSFAPAAPASKLTATLAANVALGKGKIKGDYRFDMPQTALAGQLVPAVWLAGTLQNESAGDHAHTTAQGTGHVDEPGAPIDLRFGFDQTGGSGTASFDVTSSVPDLGRTRAGGSVAGRASLHAYGLVNVGGAAKVDANLEVRAEHLAQGDQRVDSTWLSAHAQGPIDNPRLDALVQAHGVAIAGMKFANTSLAGRGDLRSADVSLALDPSDGPKLDGRATVQTGNAITVSNGTFTIARDKAKAVISLDQLQLRGNDLRLHGVRVEGLGDPLLVEARKRGTRIDLRATSNEIDLAKLGALLHTKDVRGGHLAVDVDMKVQPSGGTGYARIDLTQGSFAERVNNASAHVDTTLQGRRLTGNVHARLAEVGNLDISSMEVEVGGNGPIASSLGRAWGKLTISSDVDISRIKSVLPRSSLPFDEMQGRLRFSGNVARVGENDGAPTFEMSAETIGLVLSGRGERERVDNVRVVDAPPWRLEGIDLQLAAQHDPHTATTSLHSRAFDKQGTLISLDAAAQRLPFDEWLHGSGMTLTRVKDLPLSVELSLPRREMKKLPAIFKLREMGGSLAAKVNLDGSLAEPRMSVAADTTRFQSALVPVGHPLNAKLGGTLDNGGAKFTVAVDSDAGESLKAEVNVDGEFAGMLTQPGTELPAWRGSTRVTLQSFPLESLAMFSDVQVKGQVSGDFTVQDLHRDARLNGRLDFSQLQLGRVKYPRANAHIAYDGRLLQGGLRMEQTDGFLDAQGQVGLAWGDALTPTPTNTETAFVALKAKALRAGAFRPFVTSVLSDLDGRLDADTRIEILPGGGPPRMGGTLTYREGRFQLARLGEQFHDAGAKIAISPEGVVQLQDVVAYGSTGKVMAAGSARLNGFQLVGANATISIPRRSPLPVDVDGQLIGDVDGDIKIRVANNAAKQAMSIDVDIPTLHTELPNTPTNTVQELAEPERIRVGHFRRQRQFVLLPLDAEDLAASQDSSEKKKDPSETTVVIHLGNEVEVRKGRMLRVLLTGTPTLHITDKARMTGQIILTRGTLEVQGKRFEIERGTVTFVGDDPSNPQIVITAGWPAPDGTRVYADFVGPLKTGQVSLRSEPSRPQSEILALIMFGTADGASQTPYKNPNQADSGTQAATAVGGLATEGLDEGLNDLTGLDVRTKIETANNGQPAPEIELQVSRDISLQISYILGVPPPTNPDQTLITADWRFKRNWSLAATRGNAGTSILDLVWQYRY